MNDSELRRKKDRDTEEAGCDGLVNGFALIRESGVRFHVEEVTKADGPFMCASCLSDAVRKHCAEKRDHFAHKAPTSKVIAAGESELHHDCKLEIFEALKSAVSDVRWVCDNVKIKADKNRKLPELKPDIGGRINGKRVAIEIQVSALTLPQIIKRVHGYSGRDVAILWIVPLKEPLPDGAFSPRLYERYLHSIYYGRTYYWMKGDGLLVTPVHYGLAWRHVPYSEWYDVELGDHRDGGGYNVPFKRIRKPFAHKKISLVDSFFHHRRSEFIPWNERKAIPASYIFRDGLSAWWDEGEEEQILKRHYPGAG